LNARAASAQRRALNDNGDLNTESISDLREAIEYLLGVHTRYDAAT
jgi:hypothetical protein